VRKIEYLYLAKKIIEEKERKEAQGLYCLDCHSMCNIN
jgi:hypothetical protein